MVMWLLLFLFSALLTGIISFGGFVASTALLVFFKIIFYSVAVLFVVSLIKYIFFGEPTR